MGGKRKRIWCPHTWTPGHSKVSAACPGPDIYWCNFCGFDLEKGQAFVGCMTCDVAICLHCDKATGFSKKHVTGDEPILVARHSWGGQYKLFCRCHHWDKKNEEECTWSSFCSSPPPSSPLQSQPSSPPPASPLPPPASSPPASPPADALPVPLGAPSHADTAPELVYSPTSPCLAMSPTAVPAHPTAPISPPPASPLPPPPSSPPASPPADALPVPLGAPSHADTAPELVYSPTAPCLAMSPTAVPAHPTAPISPTEIGDAPTVNTHISADGYCGQPSAMSHTPTSVPTLAPTETASGTTPTASETTGDYMELRSPGADCVSPTAMTVDWGDRTRNAD